MSEAFQVVEGLLTIKTKFLYTFCFLSFFVFFPPPEPSSLLPPHTVSFLVSLICYFLGVNLLGIFFF